MPALMLEQTAGARGYRASFAGFPDVEVMLLSAGEIASSLLAGDIHLGITGEDLLREEAPELDGPHALDQAAGLRLCRCRGGGVAILDRCFDHGRSGRCLRRLCRRRHRRRLRVATKYAQLTRSFFAQARISDYRIVPSAGATEGAPAAGTAEVIVDITTTGATLRDNGLKILDDGVILKSQAQLAASLTADWSMRGARGLRGAAGEARSGRTRFIRRWRQQLAELVRAASRRVPDVRVARYVPSSSASQSSMRVRPEGWS